MNIHWIAGFINAEGLFSLLISPGAEYILGFRVKPLIQITQKNISLITLLKIMEFLNIGNINNRKGKDASDLKFTSLQQINTFINLF